MFSLCNLTACQLFASDTVFHGQCAPATSRPSRGRVAMKRPMDGMKAPSCDLAVFWWCSGNTASHGQCGGSSSSLCGPAGTVWLMKSVMWRFLPAISLPVGCAVAMLRPLDNAAAPPGSLHNPTAVMGGPTPKMMTPSARLRHLRCHYDGIREFYIQRQGI